MAKSSIHIPRWQVLVQLALAAEENARELINDAEVLLAAARWPRAYALAVLAHEEFGKGLMAMALAAAHPNLRQPARLRELTGGHIRKLTSTYEHEVQVGPPERWVEVWRSQELARSANERKQRGLYVDFADDGSLRLPSDVGEEEARAQVASVRETVFAVAFGARLFGRKWSVTAELTAAPVPKIGRTGQLVISGNADPGHRRRCTPE